MLKRVLARVSVDVLWLAVPNNFVVERFSVSLLSGIETFYV